MRETLRILGRGLRLRCAHCGAPGIVAGWWRLAERCPSCATRVQREEGFFLGVYFVNITITQVVVLGWIAAAFALTLPDAPLAPILVVAAVLAVATPVLAYPLSRALWAAIHRAMQAPEPEEQADAAAHRFERGDAGAAGGTGR